MFLSLTPTSQKMKYFHCNKITYKTRLLLFFTSYKKKSVSMMPAALILVTFSISFKKIWRFLAKQSFGRNQNNLTLLSLYPGRNEIFKSFMTTLNCTLKCDICYTDLMTAVIVKRNCLNNKYCVPCMLQPVGYYEVSILSNLTKKLEIFFSTSNVSHEKIETNKNECTIASSSSSSSPISSLPPPPLLHSIILFASVIILWSYIYLNSLANGNINFKSCFVCRVVNTFKLKLQSFQDDCYFESHF